MKGSKQEAIKSVKTSSNITHYQISESGIDAYLKWIKDFLDLKGNHIRNCWQEKTCPVFSYLFNNNYYFHLVIFLATASIVYVTVNGSPLVL
jgi:hypothetical protein